jgi:ABC-type transport system involved in multi-copper enzyme maturation permease subunit
MSFLIIILIILIFSFILSFLSMRDLGFAEELKKILDRKRIRGTIIFFKNRIIHYHGKHGKQINHSSNSSLSSSRESKEGSG